MKSLITLCFCIALVGCAGTSGGQARLNLVSLGMNKNQVVEVMGNPVTTSAQFPYEYFIYNLAVNLSALEIAGCGIGTALIFGIGDCFKDDDFFVRFENGLVQSYGRVGDFDSTRVPEATINVNTN